MNERIKELSLQASDSIPDDVNAEHAMYLFQKTFAELIVRECVRVLEAKKLSDIPMGVEAFTEDWDVGYNDALEDAVKCIQQHFGVE